MNNQELEHAAWLEARERDRVELCKEYGIVRDESGKYVSIGERDAVLLLNHSLADASRMITKHAEYDGGTAFHLDDDQDYLNACVDQVMTLVRILNGDDGEGVVENTLRLLNASEDDEIVDGIDHKSFQAGYADHYTPVGCLARVNIEEGLK